MDVNTKRSRSAAGVGSRRSKKTARLLRGLRPHVDAAKPDGHQPLPRLRPARTGDVQHTGRKTTEYAEHHTPEWAGPI